MGIMSIIGMIVVGFIVGLLARFFYPGAVSMGFWMTTLMGIGGSIVGGVIGSMLWKSPDGRFHPAGWILSIVGAMILIWGYLNYLQ
jgi:uncharacterized membrane protein YeaQ/YmgE (transglycosylase-associated protein family)